MEKIKIGDLDKKVIIITLVIGFIAQFFIDSGMNIALLCFCIYLIHRYMGTTDNIKEYDNYEFRDKAKYDKGLKLFVVIMDMYVITRIIYMILKPQNSYAFSEMMLMVMIYGLYEKYLEKKYVIRTNISEEKTNMVFVRNKVISSIVIIMFIIFSIVTFNCFKKLDTQGFLKYGKHEYKASVFEDKKNIEIEVGSHYMMAEESDGNSKYFDGFLEKGKVLIKKQVFKSYIFVSMLFMMILCFSEIYPKGRGITSISGNIFLVIFLLCSICYFNFDTWNDEMELTSYFHEHMNK